MLTYRDGDREMEVEMTDRQDSNFLVAVRVRPLNAKETEHIEAHPVVTRAVGDALISFDPPTQAPKGLHVRGSHRHADLRFAFDVVFDQDCTQDQVYDKCAKPVIKSVMNGINATIFAYGATGSGALAFGCLRAQPPPPPPLTPCSQARRTQWWAIEGRRA